MKIIFLSCAVAASCFCLSCEKAAVQNTEVKPANTVSQNVPTPALSPIPPKDGLYPSKGKVTKINNELGSVELDHEEIKGVMPKMLMEFYVKDKSLIKGLAVGDDVDFVLEYKHPSETIVEIKKSK